MSAKMDPFLKYSIERTYNSRGTAEINNWYQPLVTSCKENETENFKVKYNQWKNVVESYTNKCDISNHLN